MIGVNPLVQAFHSLTREEQRLVLLLIGPISLQDTVGRQYEMMIEGDKEGLEKLCGHVLEIPQPADGYLLGKWFSSVEVKGDTVKVRFDPKMKPYLLELQAHLAAAA